MRASRTSKQTLTAIDYETSFHAWDTICHAKRGIDPVRAKLADHWGPSAVTHITFLRCMIYYLFIYTHVVTSCQVCHDQWYKSSNPLVYRPAQAWRKPLARLTAHLFKAGLHLLTAQLGSLLPFKTHTHTLTRLPAIVTSTSR